MIGEFGYIFYSEDRGETLDPGRDPRRRAHGADPASRTTSSRSGRTIRNASPSSPKQIENQTHLNVLVDPFVSERELAEFGDPEDPYALFDIISARIDETKAVLEEAGILSDRLRMPNKPPWDYEDFLDDDPTFLERYFEGRKAEQPMIRVSVIQNPYLFTVFFKDAENGPDLRPRRGDPAQPRRRPHLALRERGPQAGALLRGGGGRARHRRRREGAGAHLHRRREDVGAAPARELPRRSSPSCATWASSTSSGSASSSVSRAWCCAAGTAGRTGPRCSRPGADEWSSGAYRLSRRQAPSGREPPLLLALRAARRGGSFR